MMAVDTTTTLASFTCSALWPTKMWAPSEASRSVTALRDRSEPEIWYPSLASTSAIPPIPAPPMPIK
ncbi:hypothetical protein D3C81_1730820 [compost metagenome]